MLRWRIRFSRGEELKYLSHLDLVRLWERGLRRAGVALAYSQGFSPHPHLSHNSSKNKFIQYMDRRKIQIF